MHARAIEDAEVRLRELRTEEWEDLALAALAVVTSLVATQRAQPLALPLFVGGLAILVLGVRALWRRWDLVDRLCGEGDAYVIREVLERAARETTMERRVRFAMLLCCRLDAPEPSCAARIAAAADDIRSLACELEDDELELEPASAMACMRLVYDPVSSPLLNPELPDDELRPRVLQIRAGLHPKSASSA